MSYEGFSGAAKKAFICECTNAAFVAADTVCLEFIWRGPAPRGGQFFLIKPRRTGVFLGRPISVAGWKRKGTAAGILRFIVARRGQGSRELVDLRPGEDAELIGPLGNYWALADIFTDLSPGASLDLFPDLSDEIFPEEFGNTSADEFDDPDPVALVGGGVGIASLLVFAGELGDRFRTPVPFDFYAGFRTGSFGLEDLKSQANGLRSLTIATDDGSEGVKGLITEFFTPIGYSAVFACGPEPMLKVVGDACVASDVPCFISLEKHMACGVGACLGCTVRTIAGNRRCCSDGPIFNAEEVCFDQ